MPEAAVDRSETLRFGPFTLMPAERRLTREGVPVALGARALDILVALASRQNQVIGKQELLARVWPDVTVEETSLRFQIASLRRALGDGVEGARYIATLAGRGYCFVAPVRRSGAAEGPPDTGIAFPQANLPNRLMRMVGRAADAESLAARLRDKRFVTVVGTGGVGKTTLAVAAGHDLLEAFAGAVHFVDLGALGDPGLVAPTVASMLGLPVHSHDAAASIAAYLARRRMLLILDTCEHVIDAVAMLAARIFGAAPDVHMLATSREALRAEGEHIFRLAPLACPPPEAEHTVASVQAFPAAELFLQCTMASGAQLQADDSDAAIVAEICRKVDGVPLAIELAAGRIEAYGLRRTAELLDQRLTLQWPGQRTAPVRQRTLQATLAWSYGLLGERERLVLRRLAVFAGHFTIDAALSVVTDATIDQASVFAAIDSLVAKSMIATDSAGATMRYRLLDTTRAYAQEIDSDAAARSELAARHAACFLRWLEETEHHWPIPASAVQRSLHLAGLANVRAALEWSFGPTGDGAIGVRLAAAAAPVLLKMSLLMECHRWSERAIAALDEASVGGGQEMQLQAALGVSLMFTQGGRDAARMALERSSAIAERHGCAIDQIQVLGPLQMFHLRTGEYNVARHFAERCSAIARTVDDPVEVALAHSLMGISLHLAGELDRGRGELAAALKIEPRLRGTSAVYLGFDGSILAGAILARTLWLQGHAGEAVQRARLTVQHAERLDHPLTLAIALVWAISLFVWMGDLEAADQHIDWLLSCAERYSLSPYLAVGRGFKGELAIRQGDAEAGVAVLRTCLIELHAAPYELLTTPLRIAVVQGLAKLGRLAEAVALVDDAIRSVEAKGDLCYLPELLRVKGGLLLEMPRAGPEEAETCFRLSLGWSVRQGAGAWELRTATDLAALLAARRQPESARALLQPVLARFAPSPETEDLMAAARVLQALAR